MYINFNSLVSTIDLSSLYSMSVCMKLRFNTQTLLLEILIIIQDCIPDHNLGPQNKQIPENCTQRNYIFSVP